MIRRHQDQLQLPACLEALCHFFTLQQISDEFPLICRRPFATAKWIQENETMPDEHRTENLRRLLERLAKFESVLPGSVPSAVIECDRGKRTATCGPPQKALQSKTATQNLDSLRSRRFSDLRDSLAGNRQRDCEHEQSSHRDLPRFCGSDFSDSSVSSYERCSRPFQYWRVLQVTRICVFQEALTARLSRNGAADVSLSRSDNHVTGCGRICFRGRKVNLSHVFAGQSVGVTQVGERIWPVTFGLTGSRLDKGAASVSLRATSGFAPRRLA